MVRNATARVALSVAVFAALCVVGYIVSPYRPVEGLRVAYLWLFIAMLLFAGSVILLRRVGGTGALLQVGGSAAMLLLNLFDFVANRIGHHAVDYGLGDPVPILRSLQTPVIEIPMGILGFLTLLFPIGFFLYAARVSGRTN
jgi:hypothetical protein